ncbi:MAG: UDP-N-acetylmuramate dehydrogenase [Bacteroidales bacterium]|nr:UDP-N-acetylmuramate dehydrogenase [Bacteroidales bacterium]MBR5042098.1 UDP-N-acetylmuramate dehydrogenase [Bacteroidales bacterium]
MLKENNFDLSTRNTFRMKVRCACYVEYESAEELAALPWDELPKPIKHIGGGSNLLFTGDFPGTILHSAIRYVKYVDLGLDEVPVVAGAGVEWDALVEELCSHGLWGAENLSLIPGEVGAAAVQNIGAYGVEIKDLISGVSCFDLQEKRPCKFSVGECGYGYRESMFKDAGGRYVITSVLLRVSRSPRPRLEYKGLAGIDASSPMAVREAVIGIRRSKLPDPAELGSAGSFFKNPVISAADFVRVCDAAPGVTVPHYLLDGGFVKVPAAWLIDQCGFKGEREGGAAVYEKQPLVIVNASGEASPGDVLELERRIVATVHQRFGVSLHPEVEHI